MAEGGGRLQAALESSAVTGRGGLVPELVRALVEAEVLVPTDPAGEWLVAGETSGTSGGQATLVAFTDADALQRWSDDPVDFQVRRAVEVVAVALELGAQALVIDPGSERALVLTRRGLLEVAEDVVGRGPAVEPPRLPPSQGLLEGLRDLVDRHPQVTAAYVYRAAASDPQSPGTTTVGLEVAGDASAAREDATRILAAHTRRGGEVAVLDWEDVLRVRTVAPPVGAGGAVERAAAAIRTDERARTALFDALAAARLLVVTEQVSQARDQVVPQTLDVGGRSFVPVFTSRPAAQHTRPRTQLRSLSGQQLGEVVPSGAWVVLDPGCYHTLELGPDALARIAARGVGDTGEERPQWGPEPAGS